MGLWYSNSHELCRCCSCTCCCHCRPKQTTPAFLGGLVLLGSAITLALMLTSSLNFGYYSISIVGFAASFSLLCYVVGISKPSVREAVRLQQPSSGGQPTIQTAGNTLWLDARITEGLRTNERWGSAGAATSVNSQRNASGLSTPSYKSVGQRATLGSAQRNAAPAEPMAQCRATSESSFVVFNSTVMSISSSRQNISTRTVASEYGRSIDYSAREIPTLVLQHGLVDESGARNSDAPNYFDVSVGHPPRLVEDRSGSAAIIASRLTMAQSPERPHSAFDESGQINTENISQEYLPTYNSLFPSPAIRGQ